MSLNDKLGINVELNECTESQIFLQMVSKLHRALTETIVWGAAVAAQKSADHNPVTQQTY